jgi:hypothetical protein
LYQTAIFELDRNKLLERATAAELAINGHVFADYQHISASERLAMNDALSALRLKGEAEQNTVGELIGP